MEGPLAHAPLLTRSVAGAESNVAIALTRLGLGVRWESSLGWDAWTLSNNFVFLAAVPGIGRRLMAYGPPAENPGDGSLGAWKNRGGSKTLPAPERKA